MRRTARIVLASSLLAFPACVDRPVLDPAYVEAIEQYRANREEGLRSEGGWLTLVGLYWLEPGENRFGSDPDLPVVLPEVAPALAGSLFYDEDGVRLEAAPGVTITVDGGPVPDRVLRDDTQEGTDVMELGRLRFYVIKRADKVGVRVKDPENPARLAFTGLDFFPLDPGKRFDLVLEPFDEPKRIGIMSVVGTTESLLVPGTVEFELDGETVSLLPTMEDPSDTKLWFIFSDGTSGKETYGFRYLYADYADGRVDLDFNRAYNPPCAFTPFATCPLPPKENRLAARIEAGERIYVH